MENKVILSIVIPLHNKEKYILDGLSVFSNWFPNREKIEVIIVDDLSTDKSLEIVEDYCKVWDGFKIMQNEKNLGHSITIKRGIKEAKGKYTFILDADDFLDADFLNSNVSELEAAKSDLCIFNFKHFNDTNSSIFRNKFFHEFNRNLRNSRRANKFFISIHNCVFKTSLAKQLLDKFTTATRYNDSHLMALLIANARTYNVYKNNLSFYRVMIKGQTMSMENLDKGRKSLTKVLEDIFKINDFYDQISKKEYLRSVQSHLYFAVTTMRRTSCFREIRKELNNILDNVEQEDKIKRKIRRLINSPSLHLLSISRFFIRLAYYFFHRFQLY